MATMKTLNGYGFNATELNGKTSDSYLQKTDTASDSAKLGGKAPEYYLQPRNLLDNSDFRNPVNQRGATSYTGVEYTVDRWCTNMSVYATVTVGNGKITLHKSSSGGDFRQTLPVNLTGKTMSYAVMTADGNIYCKSAVISDSSNFKQIAGLNAYLGVKVVDGQTVFTIYFNDSSDITLELVWAALYEGSYTAETLPPYVPKGYATELAECMRYYQKFQMLAGKSANAAQRVFVVLPVEMRITPTIAYELISGAQPNNVVAQTRNIVDVTGADSYSHISISLSADL